MENICMRLLCFSKKELRDHIAKSIITQYVYETSAGWLLIQSTFLGIFEAHFIDQSTVDVSQFPRLETKTKCIELLITATDFQWKIYQEIYLINEPLITYKKFAEKIGYPNAFRALGNALARNKIAYFIPCHKVIRSDGDVGGYKWGIDRKRKLLAVS